jgi:hypothetical protein
MGPLPDVLKIRKDMERQGLSGILMVGRPNLPLLDRFLLRMVGKPGLQSLQQGQPARRPVPHG